MKKSKSLSYSNKSILKVLFTIIIISLTILHYIDIQRCILLYIWASLESTLAKPVHRGQEDIIWLCAGPSNQIKSSTTRVLGDKLIIFLNFVRNGTTELVSCASQGFSSSEEDMNLDLLVFDPCYRRQSIRSKTIVEASRPFTSKLLVN